MGNNSLRLSEVLDSEWQCSVRHAQRPLPGRTIHNGWHALIADDDFTVIMSA